MITVESTSRHNHALFRMVVGFILVSSAFAQNWSNAAFQCAAAQHACIVIGRGGVGNSGLHRDVCRNCINVCAAQSCGQPWCSRNRAQCAGQQTQCSQCSWNPRELSCATAHVACTRSANNVGLKSQFCRRCREECVSLGGCNQPWCRKNAAQC